MIILGIDPGTARMGCGVIKYTPRTGIKLMHQEVLLTASAVEQHVRLKFLFDKLKLLIKKHNPDLLVIERIFFNTNAKTAIFVGQARGVVLLAAAEFGLAYYEYTALEAKKVLTGYGKADKKQMQAAVKEVLNLDEIIKSDDANDAVAMALCFVQKELVQKIKAGFKIE